MNFRREKMRKILRLSTFARRLGFNSSNNAKFHEFIKKAEEKELIIIQRSGFPSDSNGHHKVIIMHMAEFDPITLLEKTADFPSWLKERTIDGYRLTTMRTGFQRILKITREVSDHEWWYCEDCGRKINIGNPYASKVDFLTPERIPKYVYIKRRKPHQLPVRCKCIECYIDLLKKEEYWS